MPACANSDCLIRGVLEGLGKWYEHSLEPPDSNTRWRNVVASPYCLASLVHICMDIVICFFWQTILSLASLVLSLPFWQTTLCIIVHAVHDMHGIVNYMWCGR